MCMLHLFFFFFKSHALFVLLSRSVFYRKRQYIYEKSECLIICLLPGIEEEGLLLEDIGQTPSVEKQVPEEPPAELPSPELSEDLTLPEPPVEAEASGSGTGDLEDLLQPTAAAVEEDVPLDESVSDVGLVPEDAHTDADAISEAETKDVIALGEQPTPADTVTLEEKNPDEILMNETEIPEELEISTITTETEEEEHLPTLVPPPEALDVVSEASGPDVAEIGHLPVDENSVEGESDFSDVPPVDEVVNSEQPEGDAPTDVAPPNSEPSGFGDEFVFEEGGVEEATETKGPELGEDPEAPEAPAVAKETTEAPVISTDDLMEDDILLVNKEEPEPPVTDSIGTAQPTTLSPEEESPFTHIVDINPASKGQPAIIIPSLIEVK